MAKTSAAKRSKPAKSAASTNRIGLMDDLRGFCVFCMIFYHGFLLAFQSFGIVAGGQAYDFFRPVQPIFAGIFILLCGISCRLSHSNWERGLKLFGVALAINLITILGLPQLERFGFDFSGTEIWFGILNLLSVSILFFALAHKVLDWLPPAAGAYLMLVFWYVTRFFEDGRIGFPGEWEGRLPAAWTSHFWTFPLGIHDQAFWSADYFPLIPWLFLFLAGAYFGSSCSSPALTSASTSRTATCRTSRTRHASAPSTGWAGMRCSCTSSTSRRGGWCWSCCTSSISSKETNL